MGFFRIYFWERPTFSFGVSQKIKKILDLEFIEKNNCTYVRRITGGKTVLHNDEITYSVISSEETFYKNNDLYKSYMLISKIFVHAFNKIGINATLSKSSSSKLARSVNPCFSFPTPNEIEINGKKIVGSAQKRDKNALLQHGSIPVSMNYNLYAGGSNSSAELIKKNMTTLNEISSKSREEFIQSFIFSFQSFINGKLDDFKWDNADKKEIQKLEKKYSSTDWNFKGTDC